MEVFYDTVNAHYCQNLCGKAKYKVDLGTDPLGNLTRMENELAKLSARVEAAKTKKAETISQLENAKVEVQKPFTFEEELKEKTDRLNALPSTPSRSRATDYPKERAGIWNGNTVCTFVLWKSGHYNKVQMNKQQRW